MRARGCNEYRSNFNATKFSKREIKKIYESEKLRYSKENELDMEIEKLNLKSCLESYKERMTTYYLAILSVFNIAVAAVFFIVITSFKLLTSLITCAALLGFSAFVIVYLRNTTIKKEARQFTYYETCLKVLDDLEKEKEKNEVKHRSLIQ